MLLQKNWEKSVPTSEELPAEEDHLQELLPGVPQSL